MQPSTEINEVQASIVGQLFMRGNLRFSELNVRHYPSDQFSYHLRQLTTGGLIEKLADKRYQLSVEGRSRAILLDTQSSTFIKQGFVACRILLTIKEAGVAKYLVQKRTKVPFKGYIAEPGGKIVFGEDVLAAAKRNMLTETGLNCTMKVKGLAHFKDSYQEQIVQDKFFFVIEAMHPSGELLSKGPTGHNILMTKQEINDHPKVHQGVMDLFAIAGSESFGFIERTFETKEY